MVEHQRKGSFPRGAVDQAPPVQAGGSCSGPDEEGGKPSNKKERKERGGRGSGVTKKGKFPDGAEKHHAKQRGGGANGLNWASAGDGLLPTPAIAPMNNNNGRSGAQRGRQAKPGRNAGKQKAETPRGGAERARDPQQMPALPALAAGPVMTLGGSSSSATAPLRSNIAARRDAGKEKRSIRVEIGAHPYARSGDRSGHTPGSVEQTPTTRLVGDVLSFALDSPAFNTRGATSGEPWGGEEADCATELSHAVRWWSASLSRAKELEVSEDKKKRFEETLYRELEVRCAYHWHPAPRGSGYRSIVNDISTDPALARACGAAGVDPVHLPRPIIMFLNPGDVKVQHTNSSRIEVIVDEAAKQTSAFEHAMNRKQCLGWA